MSNMQKIVGHSLRTKPQQSLRVLGLCSQITKGQQTSPIVFPEKRSRGRTSTRANSSISNDKPKKAINEEHRIDVGDEKSDLLGYDILAGKLVLDKRKLSKNADSPPLSETTSQEAVDAKLTSKALIWGTELLSLEDVISVSYYSGLRYFTLHSYPYRKASLGLSGFVKKGRSRQDFRFLASSSEEAIHWVSAFADQQCYVNFLPHPLKQASDLLANEFPPESYIRCKTPPRMLVILNPRSGSGRSSKLYHGYVEPVFKLAGFQLEVVKTNSAGHARKLASSVDFNSCPDGIICVGGDGLVNEVLNGLLSRPNQKEAVSIPIGIIPAGSDNSLVWTVLGVRDPISAAITIVKSGLTAIDIFAVEWIKSGVIHFGTTVTYFGFIGDVLELSERYQKRFGPLRYFVAGFLKFFCLPKYTYEVEYLPAVPSKENNGEEGKGGVSDVEVIDMAELYTDIMKRSSKEGLPRASSLSSIDSIMTPSNMSVADADATEPSEYVRAIDAKSKRLSAGRNNNNTDDPEEVIHPQPPLSATPNWPRTRSKSRTEKGWAGLTITTNENNTRSSWANNNLTTNDREDISSTMSDPGPIWDTEPKWDAEPNKDVENPTEWSGGPEDNGLKTQNGRLKPPEAQWMTAKGHFVGILVCNHSCKTVQSLSSQVIAPKAEHDDKNLDLLLVHGSGRFRLLRFLLLLQMGKHLSLPYVEYLKVKSVKVKPGKRSHNGCGIDGELFPVNEQVMVSLLPDQCRLIGRTCNNNGKL